jgi:hypothetical protein
LLTLSCGPEGARIFVELPVMDASSVAGRGSSQAGSGGAGGTAIEGSGGAPGNPDTGSPGPIPVDAAPDTARDVARDRAPEAPATPDAAPPPPPPDAGQPEAPPPDAQPGPPPGVNLSSGLISRWKLDEATGNMADSGPGMNPGMVSGATRVAGGFPNARYANPRSLRFDGNDDFVELGIRSLPANNQRQSVAFWVNITAMPNNNRVCFSLTDGEMGGGSRLKIGFKDNRVAAWKGGDDDLVTAPAMTPGWHHYVYTYDGSTHRLYLDGVQRGTSTTAPDTGPVRNARIGAIYNNAENFQGQIDEVRVYNRPLTALEVTALRDGFQ